MIGWGLQFDKELLNIKGRVLPPEEMMQAGRHVRHRLSACYSLRHRLSGCLCLLQHTSSIGADFDHDQFLSLTLGGGGGNVIVIKFSSTQLIAIVLPVWVLRASLNYTVSLFLGLAAIAPL